MKKLKEYKSFGFHFTLYDTGIEIQAPTKLFVEKSDIANIELGKFSSQISIRLKSTNKVVKLSFSSKEISDNEHKRVEQYLNNKINEEQFSTLPPDALLTEKERDDKEKSEEEWRKHPILYKVIVLILIIVVVLMIWGVKSIISTSINSVKNWDDSQPSETVTVTESPEANSSTEEFVTENQNDTSPINDKAGFEDTAYIVSKRYIESILKSPTTADFPFLDFKSTHFGDGRYRVTSYVDSQNSYGATVRSDWSILMTYNGGEEYSPNSWELEEVIFDGKVVFSSPD